MNDVNTPALHGAVSQRSRWGKLAADTNTDDALHGRAISIFTGGIRRFSIALALLACLTLAQSASLGAQGHDRWVTDAQTCLAGTPRVEIDVQLCALALREGIRLGESSLSLSALHTARAKAFTALGNYARAQSDLDAALERNPASAAPWLQRALTSRANGEMTNALHSFSPSLELSPLHVPAMRERGYTRLIAGDITGGLSDLSNAIAANSHDSQTWTLRGVAHYMALRFADAKTDFAHARGLALAYDYLPVWEFLAHLQNKTVGHDVSITTIYAAQAADWPVALRDLFLNMGTVRDAMQTIKGKGPSPAYPQAYFYVAEFLALRGEMARARAVYESASKLDTGTIEQHLAALRLAQR
ncbi:MAG: tetratricopeptide (TPR) repeat protein [Gammaproteobacteria bacterium]|jgi:tetratricopeptide (TPR) repeat protein